MPKPIARFFAKLGTLGVLDWVYGLAACVISGSTGAIATAIGGNVIDPKHFNTSDGSFLRLLWTTFAVNAVLSAVLYLKQSPLPSRKKCAECAIGDEPTAHPHEL